jgi:hypothetical protein
VKAELQKQKIRITADEIKFMGQMAKHTWMDYERIINRTCTGLTSDLYIKWIQHTDRNY